MAVEFMIFSVEERLNQARNMLAAQERDYSAIQLSNEAPGPDAEVGAFQDRVDRAEASVKVLQERVTELESQISSEGDNS